MLETQSLCAGYYRGLDILQGVSISAPRQAITAILGANGVGKSTLLKAISGFLTPTGGTVHLDGKETTGKAPHLMAGLGVVYAPQQPGIFGEMTVEENIMLGGWTFRKDRVRMQKKLNENYEQFPALREKRSSEAHTLSGGQRRMIELARALMCDPGYVLIDEPSAGVAPIAADGVYATIGALRDARVGVILVDQDIPRALRIADYVYVIDLGRNKTEGRPSDFESITSTFWSN